MQTPPFPPSLSGNFLRRTLPKLMEKVDANMKPVSATSIVTLREITQATVRTVSFLDVRPGQEGLVAPNALSIAQAYFHPEAWFLAIYADDTPVGFAMLEEWTQVSDPKAEQYQGAPYISLWRFMIDQRFQKCGFGAQALTLLIAHVRTRPGVKNMLLSFVPKENNPEGFYARFGFARTGDEDDGELLMRLALE